VEQQTLPLLLINHGQDSEFFYATGFAVHDPALYIRFADDDDLLVLSVLELERGRQASRAKRVVDRADHGWQEDPDTHRAWARLAARLLQERGHTRARVSANLPAGYYEELRSEDIDLEIDRQLFVSQRRHKSPDEAEAIHAAQRAAEAAVAEIASRLGAAEVRDGLLWLNERPLTSERLMAYGQATLNSIGYSCEDMIVAGSPKCAMPHWSGEGQIRADAPVIIDIFPRGKVSHYHGDLTRTIVVGEVSDQVRRMYAACLAALDAAIAEVRPGVNGRQVHEAACKVLVEHGFGAATKGFEGPDGVPKMIHSTGHGVGLDVHELPNLRPMDMALEQGDVVTIEPGLYLEGLGGVRVEDSGIVTKDGFRNFTSLTRSLDPRAYL
jgi:Xaa-Pro aminopeptidase